MKRTCNVADTDRRRSSYADGDCYRKKLEDIETRQKNLRENTQITRRLTPEQLSAFNVSSDEAVNHFWQTTFNAKSNFDASREHGISKVSKETTGLAATAYDLLRGFSPMVEVVKDFGSPFGNVAIGTLCCLFAVSQNLTFSSTY